MAGNPVTSRARWKGELQKSPGGVIDNGVSRPQCREVKQQVLRPAQQDGATLKSLSRGLTALSIVLEASGGISLTELATAMGLHRATVLRIVRTLVEQGYISAEVHGRRYFAGPQILCQSVRTHSSALIVAAQPVMSKLGEETKETVALLFPAWPDLICGTVISSPHGIRRHRDVGEILSMTRASVGRAFLSQAPADYVAATLAARPLERIAPHSITEVSRFLTGLSETAKEGFTISIEEGNREMCGVSAPVILPGGGLPLAVLNVSGPSYRWGPEQMLAFGPTLALAAKRLSATIAGRSPLGGNTL